MRICNYTVLSLYANAKGFVSLTLLSKIILSNPHVFGVVRFGYRIGLNPKLMSKFQKDQT